MFRAEKSGPYFFFRCGVSWRGDTAYLAGILPNVIGFVGAVGVEVPKGKFSFFSFFSFLFSLFLFFTFFHFRRLSGHDAIALLFLIEDEKLPTITTHPRTRRNLPTYTTSTSSAASSSPQPSIGSYAKSNLSPHAATFGGKSTTMSMMIMSMMMMISLTRERRGEVDMDVVWHIAKRKSLILMRTGRRNCPRGFV